MLMPNVENATSTTILKSVGHDKRKHGCHGLSTSSYILYRKKTMLNIRPETLPGVYHGSIQRWVLKRVELTGFTHGFTLLRFVLNCTQKRKTGYFKVSFKNGVIHQADAYPDTCTPIQLCTQPYRIQLCVHLGTTQPRTVRVLRTLGEYTRAVASCVYPVVLECTRVLYHYEVENYISVDRVRF